jgi:hypothetical protein
VDLAGSERSGKAFGSGGAAAALKEGAMINLSLLCAC